MTPADAPTPTPHPAPSKPAAAPETQRAGDLLFAHGFGTRRLCAGLLRRGEVVWQGQTVTDADQPLPVSGTWTVQGHEWPLALHPLVMLHKPAGFECSLKPRHWPSVLSLLPPALRQRGMQCVGRLDQDTTGLLLLTDDGQMLHRLTSPRWHVPKIYRVDTARDITPDQLARLQEGVVLADDPGPVAAQSALQTAPRQLCLTLTQGKYHQVKRMIAAVGNHVLGLHRERIGALDLPADLPPGQWRWLESAAPLLPAA
ncbi:16S rRNA pseudouridine(516) synthase [Amphibiibacter pelophylacis]|uniref:16S rRNA pseudouridine(516) synthase n=1 Tax=Amphibiibacter pelophylacis TaxID=1799477 RepID=A0ACC6P109_9BURK